MSERISIKIEVTAGAWFDRLLDAVETIGRMANGDVPRPPAMDEVKTVIKTSSIGPSTVLGEDEAPVFNNLLCPVCGSDQFETPAGATCINGHGGEVGVTPDVYDATIEANSASNTTTLGELERASSEGFVNPDTAGAGVELADGIPHDPRIHASTRTKYAKKPFGWKLKRGVDPTLVATVTAELRAAMAIPAGGQQAPITDAEKAFGPTDTTEAGTSQEPPPPPPPETPVVINTFAELLNAITPALVAGTLLQTTIDAELATVGLASLQLLGARPDLVPLVAAKLFPGV